MNIYLQNFASFSYYFPLTSLVFLFILLSFLFFYLFITTFRTQDKEGMSWRFSYPFDLLENLISTSESFKLFLKLRISLLDRSICFAKVGRSISKLSTRSSNISLYLLEIEKISDFLCPLLIICLKIHFLRITIIRS